MDSSTTISKTEVITQFECCCRQSTSSDRSIQTLTLVLSFEDVGTLLKAARADEMWCRNLKAQIQQQLDNTISRLEDADRQLFDAQMSLGRLHYMLQKSNFPIPEYGTQNQAERVRRVVVNGRKFDNSIIKFTNLSVYIAIHSVTLPDGATLAVVLDWLALIFSVSTLLLCGLGPFPYTGRLFPNLTFLPSDTIYTNGYCSLPFTLVTILYIQILSAAWSRLQFPNMTRRSKNIYGLVSACLAQIPESSFRWLWLAPRITLTTNTCSIHLTRIISRAPTTVMPPRKSNANSGRGSGTRTANARAPVLPQQEFMNLQVQHGKTLLYFRRYITNYNLSQHILNFSHSTILLLP